MLGTGGKMYRIKNKNGTYWNEYEDSWIDDIEESTIYDDLDECPTVIGVEDEIICVVNTDDEKKYYNVPISLIDGTNLDRWHARTVNIDKFNGHQLTCGYCRFEKKAIKTGRCDRGSRLGFEMCGTL
jgi:hypothetical protein